MLGPSYGFSALALRGRRAAPAVGPVTVLDFTAGTLPSSVSLSRASSGSYLDASGTLQTAAANTPRFDHDAATLAPKGLLIEGAASNLVTHSADLSDTSWVKNAFAANALTDTAPDGTSVSGWDFGSGYAYHDLAVTAGIAHTASLWVKANQTCTIGLRAAGTTGADTVPITLTTGWSRIAVTATPASSAPKILLENRSGQGYGVTGLQVFIWGVQVEQGPVATSHIATAGAIAARAADQRGLTGISGTYDLRVTYFNGTIATILAQPVTDGYWPPQSNPWVTRIELHPAGSLG